MLQDLSVQARHLVSCMCSRVAAAQGPACLPGLPRSGALAAAVVRPSASNISLQRKRGAADMLSALYRRAGERRYRQPRLAARVRILARWQLAAHAAVLTRRRASQWRPGAAQPQAAPGCGAAVRNCVIPRLRHWDAPHTRFCAAARCAGGQLISAEAGPGPTRLRR